MLEYVVPSFRINNLIVFVFLLCFLHLIANLHDFTRMKIAELHERSKHITVLLAYRAMLLGRKQKYLRKKTAIYLSAESNSTAITVTEMLAITVNTSVKSRKNNWTMLFTEPSVLPAGIIKTATL